MFSCKHNFGCMVINRSEIDGIDRHHIFGKVKCLKCNKYFDIHAHAVPSNIHNKLMNEKEASKEPFEKVRQRNGATWLADEMSDLRSMVESEYNLNRIASILRRSEPATLRRIMTKGLASLALKYMPEAKKYVENVEKFSGRCYYFKGRK